jgi:hypothetical protein
VAAHRATSSWSLAAAGLVLVCAVALLGAYLHGDNLPTRIDAEATEQLVHVSPTRGIEPRDGYHDIAAIGAAGPILVMSGFLFIWAASRRDAPAAAVSVFGPLVAVLTAEHIVKPLVDRRVLVGSLSYPSGTTTAAAAVAAVAVWLVWRFAGARLAGFALVPAAAVSFAVAVAVVGLSWHYLTDSVAGVAYGAGVVLIVAGGADLVGGYLGARDRAP